MGLYSLSPIYIIKIHLHEKEYVLKIYIFELRTDDLRNRTITDIKATVRQI